MQSRIALVTGGNRGLGLETCRQLAAQGATVLLGARTADKARNAAGGLARERIEVQSVALDLNEPGSFPACVAAIEDRFGRVDVLVNNAAVLLDMNVMPSATEESVLRKSFEVNFFGPFLLTRHLTSLLRKSPAGRVLNLATQVATLHQLADPESPLHEDICPAYQSSKIALNALTTLFAKELRPDGVRVNSVCPGWVMTDMGHEDLPDYGDAAKPLIPAEAVERLLWLVGPEPEVPTGGFFTGRDRVEW